MSSEQKPPAADVEAEISESLNDIQLSHEQDQRHAPGQDDFQIDEGDDNFEGDAQDQEYVLELDSCDDEYKSLFATLDQLGSCLDEVESRNDVVNTNVDDLLAAMAKAQEKREKSLKKWTSEANRREDGQKKGEA